MSESWNDGANRIQGPQGLPGHKGHRPRAVATATSRVQGGVYFHDQVSEPVCTSVMASACL